MTMLTNYRAWHPFTARMRTTAVDRSCLKAVVKHSCWSAIILGLIMLALGIILRSSLITKTSSTVTSSGLLFILIGIFIICMGPLAAIYDIISNRKRNRRRRNGDIEAVSGGSRPPGADDPPNYAQATEIKSPSATYAMRFYPQVLAVEGLSDDRPPPPAYDEIVANRMNGSGGEEDNTNVSKSDSRRMTTP